MDCNACGAVDHQELFEKDGFTLLRCKACGLVFRQRMPTERELLALYTESLFKDEARSHYYIEDELTNTLNSRAHGETLKRYQKQGRLLDIGSAFGSFLKVMEDQRWEVWGNELSQYAAENAQRKILGRVSSGDFLQTELPYGYFDAVTMWDFIEHVPDPYRNIQKAKALLKDGGTLFISTGDIGSVLARILGKRWKLIKPNQHLYYFSFKSIESLLRRAGFGILALDHQGRYFNLEYLLRTCEKEYRNKAVSLFCRTLLSWRQRLPKRVYIDFRDIMTVVATKPKQ